MVKHCNKCNVDIDVHHDNCPLCGAYLPEVAKISDEEEYKQINYCYPKQNTDLLIKDFLLKITILTCILSIGICAIINFLTSGDYTISWVWHVVVGWLVFWVTIGRSIFFHLQFRRQIVWDYIFSSLLAFYIQFAIAGTLSIESEYNWALVWVSPSLAMGAMAGLAMYALIRYKEWQRFALPMTVLNVLSFVPLITYYIVYRDAHFMTFIAAAIGVGILLGMMIVGRKKYFLEIKKKFHM